ncbi:MAG: hypothetical protein WCB31_07520 [Nitrososphaeraceae archaeon]
MQHGGSFVTHAQHGFSGIVDTPTTFRGVRMGEGSKPELVTVQPLTRGSFGGSGRPIVIENIITLDHQVIDKRINRVVLGDIGLQV